MLRLLLVLLVLESLRFYVLPILHLTLCLNDGASLAGEAGVCVWCVCGGGGGGGAGVRRG